MANPIQLISRHPRAAAGTSPERAALAAALVVLRQCESEARALKDAIATAEPTVWGLEERHRTALAVIDKAKADAAEHQIATALGTAGTPPASIKEARLALADLDDEASIARLTLDGLRARAAEAKGAVTGAQSSAERARADVLRTAPETMAWIAEVARLQRALMRAGSALSRLARWDALDFAKWGPGGRSDGQILLDRLDAPMANWTMLAGDPGLDGGGEWDRALAALLISGDAALPQVRNDD